MLDSFNEITTGKVLFLSFFVFYFWPPDVTVAPFELFSSIVLLYQTPHKFDLISTGNSYKAADTPRTRESMAKL